MFLRLAFCALILLPISANAAVWIGPSGSDVTITTSTDDVVYGPISLNLSGFKFFGGATQSQVIISTNGNLQFGTGDGAYSNTSFPYVTPMIAPFWDDLILPPGSITYNNATAGQFVASWIGVGRYPNGGTEDATFQAVLFGTGNQYGLAAGSILFNYQTIDNVGSVFDPTVGLNSGSVAAFIPGTSVSGGFLNATQATSLSNRSFLFTPSGGTYTVQEISSLAVATPEPASLLIWSGLGIAGYVAARRRMKRAA